MFQTLAWSRLNLFFNKARSDGPYSLYARATMTMFRIKLVGSSGLEPPTSRLSGVRSNHLSYEPTKMVEMNGIEPMTPCLQSRCSPS